MLYPNDNTHHSVQGNALREDAYMGTSVGETCADDPVYQSLCSVSCLF